MAIKPTIKTEIKPQARQLDRRETHDLSMIIKDRAKVLRSHAEHQAAACMADFEEKLAAAYKFDDDPTWRAAAEAAQKAVDDAQKKIEARCKELGIPKRFAPGLEIAWRGRGENAMRERRTELRRVARTAVDAMLSSAIVKIDRQALDLRTQVVSMLTLSGEARLFLESLATVDEMMRSLDFAQIESKVDDNAQKMFRRITGSGIYGE